MKKISILGFHIHYYIKKSAIGYVHIFCWITYSSWETVIQIERGFVDGKLQWSYKRINKALNPMYK